MVLYLPFTHAVRLEQTTHADMSTGTRKIFHTEIFLILRSYQQDKEWPLDPSRCGRKIERVKMPDPCEQAAVSAFFNECDTMRAPLER